MVISKRTAETAWAWAQANENTDSLAEAFIGACAAVGMATGNIEPAKRLGISFARMAKINALAFAYRDELARLIVRGIKNGKLTNLK